jgi:hypothetical protein
MPSTGVRIVKSVLVAAALLMFAGGAPSVQAAATAHAATAGDTPEALMRRIMASYRENAKEPNAMLADKYYEPSFKKLMDDNGKLFDGVDAVDADPVCQCQDMGGKYKWSGKLAGPDKWIASVSRDDVKEPWQVIWHKTGGRWLIYDVVSEHVSLRGLLERHNSCARAKMAKHQKTDDCSLLK